MTIITPDLIEKAARSIFDLERIRHPVSPDLEWEDCREDHLEQARAALQAVIPEVVASCAAVADIAGDVAIAAEIRSLAGDIR